MSDKLEMLDRLGNIADHLLMTEMEAAVHIVKNPNTYDPELVKFCKDYTEGDLFYGF